MDTHEQPDEEVHRVRSGRVASTGTSLPRTGVGYSHSMWIRSLTWKLSKPHPFGFLWRLYYMGRID